MLIKYETINNNFVVTEDSRFIGSHVYDKESLLYKNCIEGLASNQDTWEDHELCEIYIIHPEFGVDPKVFEKCIMDLCRGINTKFDEAQQK